MRWHNGSLVLAGLAAAALALALSPEAMAQAEADTTFGFGEPASEDPIERWQIAIPPDGANLPDGSGTPSEGAEVYAQQCAACHGEDLEGIAELGGVPLVGGRDSLDTDEPLRTVESYWPYATTVFDYNRRAMPFTDPGSMTDGDVYAVTAYILYRGDIIDEDRKLNAETLPEVEMPNRDGFVPHRDRPQPGVRFYK